jgi:hypothetical protein
MITLATKFSLGTIMAAGVLGGILFALFEMLAAAVLMGPDAFFMPLRMIGAMVLGAGALDPGSPLAVAAVTGLVIHVVLSILFALIFAAMASPTAATTTLALAGIVYGIVLWLVNFYAVAPLAGWRWFPDQTNPVVQLIAHAFFYGCPVAWLLARSRTMVVQSAP